jgi:hypothetical protein
MRLLSLLVFLASSAGVVGLSAPAQADGADPRFVAALRDAGITYQDGTDVTGIGRRECQLMDLGRAEPDVIAAMVQQNPGFTTDAATRFTQIAEQDLCPRHIGGKPLPTPTPEWQPPIDFPIFTPPAV